MMLKRQKKTRFSGSGSLTKPTSSSRKTWSRRGVWLGLPNAAKATSPAQVSAKTRLWLWPESPSASTSGAACLRRDGTARSTECRQGAATRVGIDGAAEKRPDRLES